MSHLNDRLIYLFNSFYKKTIKQNELDELYSRLDKLNDDELTELLSTAWADQDPEAAFFDVNTNKNMLDTILSQPLEQEHSISRSFWKPLWKKVTLAAAVVLIVSAGLFQLFIKETPNGPPVAKNKITDLSPGKDIALLTLASGEQIPLDSSYNKLSIKEGAAEISKSANNELIYKTDGDKIKHDLINKVSTPKGGQYKIVLSDGTKVWLNAASSIKFPSTFTGKKRVVTLEGEAYFEVAKSTDKPFEVLFSDSRISVMGTHFNVMAYNDGSLNKTTLVEGSIKLSHGTETKTLVPGQQAFLNKNQLLQLEKVNTDTEIAWKNGLFIFQESGVDDIMYQVSRWYNVDVEYERGIPKKRFTGTVSRSVNLSELLSMLTYAGTKCAIKNGKIIVTNK